MKLKESEIKEIIKEIISELKIVKFSSEDMKTLHSNGQVEKEGIFYQYHNPTEEGGKGSGPQKGGKKKKPTYHYKGDDKLVSLKVREVKLTEKSFAKDNPYQIVSDTWKQLYHMINVQKKKGKLGPKGYKEMMKISKGLQKMQQYFYQRKTEGKLTEAWKTSKGSGRGRSWMNYDKGNIRLQVTKDGSKYSAWLAKIPNSSGKYMFDLTGLNKSHIETLKVLVQNTDNLSKAAKLVSSKFKKYKR